MSISAAAYKESALIAEAPVLRRFPSDKKRMRANGAGVGGHSAL
jgi:hypothetical protein